MGGGNRAFGQNCSSKRLRSKSSSLYFFDLLLKNFCIWKINFIDLTSVFTICKEDNRNECLKGAIQDALRKLVEPQAALGTLSADPLLIEKAVIPAGPGTVHVEQHYKNIKIYNFGGSEVKEVKSTITAEGFDLYIDLFSPEYKMEADYTFNGRVLLLPITGDGSCVILLDNIETQVQVSGETMQKDGKTYGDVKKIQIDLLPKKVSFQFNNLFNGDKLLGESMNKILNENWETLFHDVKESYENMLEAEGVKFANMIFNNFEYKTIFP